MGTKLDAISVVEACYWLEGDEHAWLQRVVNAVDTVMRPERGLVGYHLSVQDEWPRFELPVQSPGATTDLAGLIHRLDALLQRQKSRSGDGRLARLFGALYRRIVRAGFQEPVGNMLLSERRLVAPAWMYTLGAPIDDLLYLVSHHVDGHGATILVGALSPKRTLRHAEREMYLRLTAHVKAGFRLRRKLVQLGSGRDLQVHEDGAVLDPGGKVLHAEGQAQPASTRRSLSEAARRLDRARSERGGRGPEALEAWQGLVEGRWSIVDHFDSDGRRYLLVHRNDERVGDPRSLSSIEVRVVALAVRGYGDSLIAYHLGLGEGTVSTHIASALRKLRLANRLELVRLLGSSFPVEDKS